MIFNRGLGRIEVLEPISDWNRPMSTPTWWLCLNFDHNVFYTSIITEFISFVSAGFAQCISSSVIDALIDHVVTGNFFFEGNMNTFLFYFYCNYFMCFNRWYVCMCVLLCVWLDSVLLLLCT